MDHPSYRRPVEIPPGTRLEFHFVGEYEYLKCLWCQNEAQIATLNVWEPSGAEWAADFFALAYRIANEKFWQSARGYPAGAILFADRRMTFQPHVGRQDNFHPIRQLMLNILTLERIIQRGIGLISPANDAQNTSADQSGADRYSNTRAL